MNYFRASILCFLLAIAAKAYPSTPSMSCMPAQDLMKQELAAGYGFLATAIAKPGIVVQFYMNMDTGKWRMIGIDEKMNACQLLDGINWQFVRLRGI